MNSKILMKLCKITSKINERKGYTERMLNFCHDNRFYKVNVAQPSKIGVNVDDAGSIHFIIFLVVFLFSLLYFSLEKRNHNL